VVRVAACWCGGCGSCGGGCMGAVWWGGVVVVWGGGCVCVCAVVCGGGLRGWFWVLCWCGLVVTCGLV
jgi:hypothetical protein